MRIERIRLKNFKVFQNVELRQIAPFSVFVGANGVGKTTLFDVFGFLRDCLRDNVRPALAKRGGFKEFVSRGHEEESIEIEIALRMQIPNVGNRTVTYLLEIENRNGQPIVAREVLRYRRFGGVGVPFHFIDFRNGEGTAIVNESEYSAAGQEERESQRTDSPDILAIKGLGQFQRFEAASAFRSLIENWHVSDFYIQAARGSKDAGYAEHLSSEGENLPLVTQYLYEYHRSTFDRILRTMENRVPGVVQVDAKQTEDGRVVLRFQDGSFKDPFVARYVSDGTIKMFAYLVLLNDPSPHPLLCVEEPENQLYPYLLGELAEEFHQYAVRGDGQVFVSTHSPDFLNAVPLESIFMLTKHEGFTSIYRAADNENLQALVDAGDPPGRLWRQKLLTGASLNG